MSDSVGSVSVEVVPDARGWSEKLRAQLHDLTVKIRPELDQSALASQIAEMKAELGSVTGGTFTEHGDVKVETAAANAKLDEIIAKEAEAGRDRHATIKVDEDRSSSRALSEFSGGLGLIPALALAAGTALIPLGAALAGVVGALAAPLAIAAGGATLFAFLGGFAIKDTLQQVKQIDQLKQKLDGLKKGTQQYTDTLHQLHQAQAALSPVQARFVTNLDKLKTSFHNTFMTGAGAKALFGPINSGLGLLTTLMPRVLPLIRAASGAFSTLLDGLNAGAKSAGFTKFVHEVARQLGPDLVAFGHIAGNVVKGVSGLFLQFGRHLSGPVLDALERFTRKFSNIGQSKGLQSFFAYLERIGPTVAQTLSDVAGAIGHIIRAAAPIGPVVLKVFDGLARAINKIPTNVLTGIVAGIAGFAVVSTVIGPLSTLVDLIGAIAAAPEIFAVVGAIVAIGVAVGIAYGKFKSFRDVIDGMGHTIKNLYIKVWHQLGDTWRTDILPTLRKMRPQLQEIGTFLGKTAGVVLKVAAAFEGRYLTALIRVAGFLFKHLAPAIADSIVMFIRMVGAIGRFAGAVGHGIGSAIGWIGRLLGWAARMESGFARAVAGVVNAMGRMAGAIGAKVGAAIGVVRSIPGRIRGALGNLGGLLVGAGRAIVQGLINGMQAMLGPLIALAHRITSLIPLHKGPMSKDLVLLHPAGRAIMSGLINGMQDGVPALRNQLSYTTDLIGNLPVSAPTGGYSGTAMGALASSLAGGAGGGAVFNLYDADGDLMGTMQGIADSSYYANGALAGQAR